MTIENGAPKTWELEALSPERRRAMEFLYRHLPESDLDCYSPSLFLQFTDHALFLRETLPWCACLEEEIFYHYVLFPRVNDEDLSFHRKLFYDALFPRIKALSTLEEMVLEANRWCQETASYQAADERTASPLTVYKSGIGRCGEESAFLVSALRSVGIPARQVYAPRWAHCDDNHAWVEALCGGVWRFLGACEPEPVLDRGWFNTAASRAVLVHSRLFGKGASPLHGELLGREGGVFWYNQTPRYARVRPCTFRAVHDAAPAPGAVFHIQLLNEAGFHTIAALTADSRGEARAALGIGDVHVHAIWGGLTGEGDCTDGTLTLSLAPPEERTTGWESFDAHAPEAASVCPAPLTRQQLEAQAAVLRRGTALRMARIASFSPSGSHPQKWAELLAAARGNASEIAAFLEADGDPRRERLLRTLTTKDLLDATAETLQDHLGNAPGPDSLPPEIYDAYVLCPRIALEPLTAWRGKLRRVLPQGLKDPAALWAHLRQRMDTGVTRTYGSLVWTPAEAWQAGRCDERSLKILFIALLRTLGIPARLRSLDGAPEFWQSGSFRPLFPEERGVLHLTLDAPMAYRQNWSLSRRRDCAWELLDLPDRAEEITLTAGQYRLITTLRLPGGSQFAAKRELLLPAGTRQTSDLPLRRCRLEDMLRSQVLPVMPAVTPEGQPVPNICLTDGRPSLLCWLEEGREPTEHLLAELGRMQPALEKLPLNILFLLRGRESLADPTLSGLLDRFPRIRVLLDDWDYDLECTARHLTCDPSTPPLSVVCSIRGQAVYGASGYQVGSGELLTRICGYICKNVN